MQQSGGSMSIRNNTLVVTAKFLYEHILIRFGCPLTIVTNQGTHFINDAIKYLIDNFILRHTNYIECIIRKEMDRLKI